jgi:hypothetical protein
MDGMMKKEYLVLWKYSNGTSEKSSVFTESLREAHKICEDMFNENIDFVVDFEVVGIYCPATKTEKYFS